MAKLWDKGYEVDGLIERFTAGEDYLLDNHLLPSDCVASIAHARMLNSIDILKADEFEGLKAALLGILRDHEEGRFIITREDEDCHTAIENRLTAELGETGKRIHTGRSRNDQVLTALRLYGREMLLRIHGALGDLIEVLLDTAETRADIPMPGRTHMQIAMPSSVGLWAAAWAEALTDSAGLLWSVYDLYNQCPLGAAASYGVPLLLDRPLTAGLLGFPRVQNNVLYVNNSRGAFEAVVLDVLDSICITLSKMAQDLMLFSLPEFAYVSLPAELCTGSSIMPQKKNPDGLELIRAKSAVLGGYAATVKSVIRSLPSGYNRDFQETKGPFLRGMAIALQAMEVMKVTIGRLEFHEEALRGGFTPEIYATDAALNLVKGGMSFRDAYRRIGEDLPSLSSMDPDEAIANRGSPGMSGNLSLERTRQAVKTHSARRTGEEERIAKALSGLLGFVPALARGCLEC